MPSRRWASVPLRTARRSGAAVVYDLLRREADKYLPYARPHGGGAFDASAVANQESFYRRRFGLQTQPYAYSRDVYECSPVGRVLESRKPGAAYRDGRTLFATPMRRTVRRRFRVWMSTSYPRSFTSPATMRRACCRWFARRTRTAPS